MSRNQTPLLAQAARGELIANGGRRYCRTCNCMKTAATFHKRGAMVRCDDCQKRAVAAWKRRAEVTRG